MKKQMIKKPMALLLVLIMVFSLLPSVALAADEGDTAPSTTSITTDLSTATENISITSGGDYTLTGSTTIYNVTIDTTDAKNKEVNLTLDGASIQIPDGYDKGKISALSISGDAKVNMIVKEGTTNTLSNECSSGGYGITMAANSSLNITGTGTLNVIGTINSLEAKTGSRVSIDDATVNISTSKNGSWSNCVYLQDTTLTVNSGSLNATVPNKKGAGISASIFLRGSDSHFIQNGGIVRAVNQTNGSSCCGIESDGTVEINGGTLFACGKANGIKIDKTMFIDDDAVVLAVCGNDGFPVKNAAWFYSTGKLVTKNGSGKGIVSLKLDYKNPITADTQIALKHKTTGAFAEEIAETLPIDAYYLAFSAKLGDQYGLTAGKKYVVTEDNEVYSATYTLKDFVAQPKLANALVSDLPESFTLSMPESVTSLKVNSSVKLGISPSYMVNWSSDSPSVATVDADGVVTALSAGTATITAECFGVTGTYELTTTVMSNTRPFTLTSDNPDVNVVISDGMVTYNPTSIKNGVFSYVLEDGDYTYAVSKEGFPVKEGMFTVSESGNNSVSISMYYNVEFNLTAGNGVDSIDGAIITVLDSQDTPVSGTNGQYDNLNGEYFYTVSCDGCYTASGSFDSYGTINLVLNKDRSGSGQADWSGAFNHDDSNAVIPVELPTSADNTYEKWATMVGTNNHGAAYAGTSVIIGGYLYITGNGYLNKIDTKTGKIISQTEAGTTGYIYDYLAYGDGTIFLSGSSYISAYEAETLNLLWRTSVGGEHSTQVNGSLNSKGTINKFRPIVYSNGYIFCGKNAFKTTSFEIDENGYNMPVFSIDDDFNWNSGVVVDDYYYVAAAQTLYAINYKMGEIIDKWKFSDNDEVYTWSGVTYSADTQRLYWASYSGAKFYTIKIDTTTGELISSRFCPSVNRKYTVDVSQESVCTPVVFNGRVYLVGQKGNVDVLNAEPTFQKNKYTLETIYTAQTPERTKIQGTPILCTAYATEKNDNTVYLYFQGYTKPSPIYVLKDSVAITSAKDVDVKVVASPTKTQFAFEQIATDKAGSLYFFNESGYLFCFEKLDSITTDSVVALFNALPSSKNITSESETQIKNARKAYDALTDEQKSAISGPISKKIIDAETALANLNKPSPDKDKDITVYFTLLGTEKDGANGTVNTLKRGNLTTWIARKSVTVKSGTKVGDVFSKVLDDNNYKYEGLSGNYIKKITIPSGVTLGQFDNGKLSGWMYTVNGKHPNVGLNDYELSNSDEIIWHYTDDYTEEEGSKKWGHKSYGSKTENNSKAKVSIDINAKIGNSGEATATVSSKEMKDSLKKALEAIKSSKKKLKPEIVVEVKADRKATSVTTTIPTVSEKEIVKAKGILSLKTPIGDVTFDTKALTAIAAEADGSDIKLTIEKVETSKDKVISSIARLNDRPVFNLSAVSKNKEIRNFKNGKVTFYLPYTLKKNEKKNCLRITHISDDGVQTVLSNSSYDESRKAMKGVTNHFSYYAVTYSDVVFDDVTNGKWFYDSVMYLVDKEIIKGKTEKTFAPNDNITRAEFVAILARMSGQKMSEAGKDFADVKNTSWYAKYVTWAVNAGIAKGMNESEFLPNANISRQDMSVMIARYADYMKKNISGTNEKIKFTDEEKIAVYANEAVNTMQKAGIINGVKAADGSYSFAPKNNATRAQAAKMIYQLAK